MMARFETLLFVPWTLEAHPDFVMICSIEEGAERAERDTLIEEDAELYVSMPEQARLTVIITA